jgi:hypothetical protein
MKYYKIEVHTSNIDIHTSKLKCSVHFKLRMLHTWTHDFSLQILQFSSPNFLVAIPASSFLDKKLEQGLRQEKFLLQTNRRLNYGAYFVQCSLFSSLSLCFFVTGMPIPNVYARRPSCFWVHRKQAPILIQTAYAAWCVHMKLGNKLFALGSDFQARNWIPLACNLQAFGHQPHYDCTSHR